MMTETFFCIWEDGVDTRIPIPPVKYSENPSVLYRKQTEDECERQRDESRPAGDLGMRRTWSDSSGFSFVLGYLTPGTQEAGHPETPMMVTNKNLNKCPLSLANEPGRGNSAKLNFEQYMLCSSCTPQKNWPYPHLHRPGKEPRLCPSRGCDEVPQALCRVKAKQGAGTFTPKSQCQ